MLILKKKVSLSINIVGEGGNRTGYCTSKSADYLSGTIVRLTAIPAEEDWSFQGWTEYPDSSETIDLVITEATSVTVTFRGFLETFG